MAESYPYNHNLNRNVTGQRGDLLGAYVSDRVEAVDWLRSPIFPVFGGHLRDERDG
jgi:hypothetical protein